mmetsp:Transcript_16631/g.16552  ORF Transcript_16631/g.16552 Transcript_16631/m.16552 type:complete len:121 (-) Transcript_16631:369-731(-)
MEFFSKMKQFLRAYLYQALPITLLCILESKLIQGSQFTADNSVQKMTKIGLMHEKAWYITNQANVEHTKVVRMKLESRALSERSFISLGQVSCSEVDLNDNNPLSKLKARKGKIEDVIKT